MFDIIINNEIETYGLISYNMRYENGILYKEGLLKTHLYIEEITSLECSRFRLEGIDVYSESFGSTDVFNLYQFTFELYDIKEVAELSEDELIKLYDNELK